MQKPKLTNLKLTVETIQCYFYGIVETGKCELSTPQDKLKVPTEHALEGCVWWPVVLWASTCLAFTSLRAGSIMFLQRNNM